MKIVPKLSENKEYLELMAERNRLVTKQYSTGINNLEKENLKKIREKLDEIESTVLSFDHLEKIATKYEKLGKDVHQLLKEIKNENKYL